MRTLPLFLIITSFTAMSYTVEANQKVYTWTDSNGTVHYSDRPVQGGDSDELKQENSSNIATLAPKTNQWQQDYQEAKETNAEEQSTLDAEVKQKEAYCKHLKRRLALFTNGGRIFNTSENGERSYYSDDGIASELKKINKDMKKCK